MRKDNEIEITPTELRFRFQVSKSVPSQLLLQNHSNEIQAFKIKTTSPKKYCVRPASGFINAKETKQIEVIMQPQKEHPTPEASSKDKFLIVTTPISSKEVELNNALFDKRSNNNVRESRVRAIVEIPKPPETIAEHPEEEPQGGAPAEDQQNLHQLIKERSELLQQVENLKRKVESTGSEISGFTVFHLLMVAILAFLIGHYLQF